MTLTISTTGIEDYLDGGKGTFRALIAGQSGAGKTRMASFAPRPIYAACEDGLMSVADRNVPYGRIKSEADMDAFLRLLEEEAKRPPTQRRWETVVIDTIDAYERTVITNYLKRLNKLEMSGFEDWGYLASRMNNIVGRLALLPFNVIVLVHTKLKDVGGITQVILKLKGEVGQGLPEDFDFVGLIKAEPGLVQNDEGKNQRGIRRFIKWEPTLEAPFLKCRGGALTETEVTFDTNDFDQIFSGLRSQLGGLSQGEQVVQIETQDEVTPPAPGGPVSSGPRRAPKATVGGSGAPPAPAPAKRPVPPPPPVVSPPPAAPAPDPTPAPTHDEAVKTVKEALGGEVIEETMDGMEVAQPKAVEPPQEEKLDLPDAEPTPVKDVTEPEPEPAPAAPPKNIPTDGEITVQCGDPRYADANARANGCGKELGLTLESGRVVATNSGDRADLIEVAGVRERTFLCNPCFAAARQAAARQG